LRMRLLAMEQESAISVIINERSGVSERPDAGGEIQALFEGHGRRVRLERVRQPGDLASRARQAASRGDVLVAVGCHGTVNAVALIAVENRVTLGVLPMGTLNHFARDLGLPQDLEDAVRIIVAGHAVTVDVGEVNGRIFVNNSSVGLYPRMVWERDAEQRRGRRKWTAFGIAMLRTWRSYRTLTAHLVVEGKTAVVRTPFIFVGNNQYTAEGFQLGGRSRLDAGHLSIFVAPECGRFEILSLPVRALTGRLSAGAPFAGFQADSITVKVARRRVSVALDGELTLLSSPLTYRVRPGALSILAQRPQP
jgi:YegS/Rv2252/BmrU family lipid kinase